ncbi:OLC1v1027493C1 [Oldenlandia corymbosa var. corymbosa]|uniref:OLC1v1027493C1 n=1 Tax=Oldenlandia corymbosa var. corymbosa TaxID=529605 RepID=A0AAV1CBK8_OLDCO|nr:OLC1v1027493C1 [Oldenlandia corymbosa var. corymbosa]
MASGSARKKSSKRPISSSKGPEPQTQLHASTASMASPASSFYLKHRRNIFLLTSFALVCGLIVVLHITYSSPPAFESSVKSSNLHTVEVINEFPHDPEAFTQGLLYAGNDTLFESTGLNGQSSVRKVTLQTGKVQVIQKMDYSYFGEGLTLLGERLYQVTWLQKTGFSYDRNNLSNFEKFTHQMKDGWGLTTDGKILFGTDGSSTLYQIDPQTMKVTAKQIVRYKGREVPNLNELEYVNGEVWANVWQTDCIARISYTDGTVLGWVLLPNLREGLLAAGSRRIDVLNGIAWDEENNRLFVTGKLWPKLYEIKLHPITTPFNGDIEHICIPLEAHF